MACPETHFFIFYKSQNAFINHYHLEASEVFQAPKRSLKTCTVVVDSVLKSCCCQKDSYACLGHEMSVEPRLWCFGDGTFDPFGNILWCYESWKVFKQGQLLLKNSEMSFWSQLNRFLKVWSEVVSGIYVIVWFIIFIKKTHFPGVWVFAHFLIRNLRIKKP